MASEQFLSLSEDDFEVIQSGVDSTYRSIDPSLSDSLVIPPMLLSTTTLTDEKSIKNDESTITNDQQETGLLNSSILSIASSNSSDAITAMLRSQAETISLMEKQLQEFSIIQESINASASLQSKVEDLSMRNQRLEKELEETRNQLTSLKTISNSIQSNVRQEVDDEIRKNDSIISSLSQQTVPLEQSMMSNAQSQPREHILHCVPSLDEMEKLRQENDNLKKTNTELHSQLSEYAKRLNERELRKTLQSSVNSMELTGSISVEDQQVTRAIQELMSKSDECEQQKKKIRELEAELSNCKAEAANNVPIIAARESDSKQITPEHSHPFATAMPEFLLQLDTEQVEFASEKLGEEACTSVVKIKNTQEEKYLYKMKCSSNELFRIRPSRGYIKPGETESVKLIFYAGKPVPESGKHYFSVYYRKADGDEAPRSAWTGKEHAAMKRLYINFSKKKEEGKEEKNE